MPRHEPAKRQTAGEPPPERLKMRLGADGNWVVEEPAPPAEPVEPDERPDESG